MEATYESCERIVRRLIALKKSVIKEASFWQRMMLKRHHNDYQWRKFIKFKQNVDGLYNFEIEFRDMLDDLRDEIVNDEFARLNAIRHDVSRAVQATGRIQKSLELLLQLHFAAVAHRNNEILRMLAIFSAIFLPLTLVTGIFGMNFHQMPLLANPHGYDIISISMASIGLFLITIFKLKRWI